MAEASQLFSQKANDYRSGPHPLSQGDRVHPAGAGAARKQSSRRRMRHRYLFSDAFGLRLFLSMASNPTPRCSVQPKNNCIVPNLFPSNRQRKRFRCPTIRWTLSVRHNPSTGLTATPFGFAATVCSGRTEKSLLSGTPKRPSPSPDAGLSDNLPFAVRAIPRLSQRAGAKPVLGARSYAAMSNSRAAPQIHRLQNPQTRSREQRFHW